VAIGLRDIFLPSLADYFSCTYQRSVLIQATLIFTSTKTIAYHAVYFVSTTALKRVSVAHSHESLCIASVV